jgi:hypothetical protein
LLLTNSTSLDDLLIAESNTGRIGVIGLNLPDYWAFTSTYPSRELSNQ